MLRSFVLVGLLVALVPCSLARSQENNPLDSMSWLAGCWEETFEDRVIQEQWSDARGGMMLGLARFVAGGKTVSYEFLRIEVADGKAMLVALPSGQAEATFEQGEVSESVAVFTNPRHDFPKTVRYEKRSDGKLLTRVEGELDGAEKSIEHVFVRVACPGGM